MLSYADLTDIENRFAFHAATDEEKKMAHGSAREVCRDAAVALADKVLPGRERSLMLTSLEEAMFWANAGIARQKDA